MAEPVASLRAHLALDSAQFERGEKRVSAGSRRMRGNLRSIGRGFDLRNVSLQMSQVAQQATATGDPLRAFAIQIPDLALSFGTLGIALGAVAGAVLPLAVDMLSAGDAAEMFKDRMKELKDVQAALRESLDLLKLNIVELRERYGEAAEAVRRLSEAQAQLRLADLSAQLAAQTGILRDAAQAYYTTATGGRTYRNTLIRIARAFAMTSDQARAFETALEAAATSETLDKQRAALEEVFRLLEASGTSAMDIPPELRAALSNMIDLVRETAAAEQLAAGLADVSAGIAPSIGAAAGEAARLAENLGISLSLAGRLAAMGPQGVRKDDGPVSSGRGGDPRTQGGSFFDWKNRAGTAFLGAYRPPKKGRGAGRGGGASKAERLERQRLNRLETEARRIKDDLRSATQRLKDDLAELTEMQKLGFLSTDQLTEAQARLRQEFAKTQFAPVIEQIDAISDAIGQAIVTGQSMGDTLAGVFKQIAADLVSSGIRRLLMQTFDFGGARRGGGGLLGSLVSGLFGGFRADGGPVNPGRAYVVGEQGPELMVPQRSGSIIPNHALGHGELVVHAYADQGVILEVSRSVAQQEVRAAGPGLVQEAVRQADRRMQATKAFGNRR